MSRFDAEALNWDSKKEVVQTSQSFYELLVKRFEELSDPEAHLAILDLGCGTGLVSQRLAECKGVERLIGVDTSKGMIDVYNSKRDNVPSGHKMKGVVKLLEDPNDPVLEGQKFDIALMHLTLHHVPDMQALIHTLTGTLKPGGRLLLSDFEDTGEASKRFHPEHKHHDVERHGIKRTDMEKIMKEAGLNDVKVNESFSLPKTLDGGKMQDFPFILGVGSK